MIPPRDWTKEAAERMMKRRLFWWRASERESRSLRQVALTIQVEESGREASFSTTFPLRRSSSEMLWTSTGAPVFSAM